MKERPILFSAPMVRALLAGTKTQTRRVFKARNGGVWPNQNDLPAMQQILRNCPYGQPGDRLWVRETWRHTASSLDEARAITEDITSGTAVDYRADYRERCMRELGFSEADTKMADSFEEWRPSIHMPRWACRITLEVTGVRVERLQDISEADAIAEGIEADVQPSDASPLWRNYTTGGTTISARYAYETLWEQINGPGSWDENPLVWVVEFKRAAS